MTITVNTMNLFFILILEDHDRVINADFLEYVCVIYDEIGQRSFKLFTYIEEIKYCRAEIALHGLYHEIRRGQIDNFGTSTKATAGQEIRARLHIFQEVGYCIHPSVLATKH